MLGPFDTPEAAAEVRDQQAAALVVCAAFKGTIGGRLAAGSVPQFFLAPDDADDDYMRTVSFEITNGRPISSYETWLLTQAEAQKANVA